MKRLLYITLSIIFLLFSTPSLLAVENEECLDCHEGEETKSHFLEFNKIGYPTSSLKKTIDGEEESDSDDEELAEIDLVRFEKSVHGDHLCTDCHTTATVDHEENEIKMAKVNCQECHEDEYKTYSGTVHGEAFVKRHDQFAPSCSSCHGNHYILPSNSPVSSTYILNIPETCGRCHKEGTEMTATHEIHQDKIIEHYSMSIHKKALFERGLTVAPACTTCHGTHDILNHENPKSKINKDNVAETCMQCHGLIEETHKPMIMGQLWEKEPNKPPVCVECHKPHDLQKAVYDKTITDEACLECHSNPELKTVKDGEVISLYVDKNEHENSIHKEEPCVKCHFDIHPYTDEICKDPVAFRDYMKTPNAGKVPVCKPLKPVECTSCHEDEDTDHQAGIHGQLVAENDADAPDCLTCHGKHDIRSNKDPASPTFPLNISSLCGSCHQDGEKSAIRNTATTKQIVSDYTMSIHGQALHESKLTVSANCASCHTPHKILPAQDPESSVNHANLSGTCNNCHFGIADELDNSIHSFKLSKTDAKLPTCNDCHTPHKINRHDEEQFRLDSVDQCGKCHQDLMETYSETYHGKVSKLGISETAKCSDCHGSHNVLPATYLDSTLHPMNIKDTCKTCHPGSNLKFTGYLPHATHNDKVKYPILYYSFWGMTGLLIGTFGFFGLHTLLWLIRSLIEIPKERKKGAERRKAAKKGEKHVRRFRKSHSVLHIMVIVSFLTLALTGMALKFSENAFFIRISWILGGPIVMGYIHRLGAVITLAYAAIHLFQLAVLFKEKKITPKGLLTEEYSLIPLPRDFIELKNNVLYFIGLGPKPKFGRWTYWEKFDYMAIFWGIMMIGVSGLILWFPEYATLILPGWAINVATIIHSDEALLATGFIFIIHFFHTHMRPEKFPMDTIIFTQRAPISEFKEERPREYENLVKDGKLESLLVDPLPSWFTKIVKIMGFSFLGFGLFIIAGIIYALIGS